MDPKLQKFAIDKGWAAAQTAAEQYKQANPDFDEAWKKAMAYASGVTTAHLAAELSKQWVAPLKRQARMASLSAFAALVLLAFAMFYIWSLASYASFVKFVGAFIPVVAAVVFSGAKSYKAWAEARRHLAEAKVIAASNPAIDNER